MAEHLQTHYRNANANEEVEEEGDGTRTGTDDGAEGGIDIEVRGAVSYDKVNDVLNE